MGDKHLEERTNQTSQTVTTFYWTGNPFVDAGLTALLLISNKKMPEELTAKDVKEAIDFASHSYARKEWSSNYIHGMIMPDNGIILANPATTGPISTAIKNAIKQEKSLKFGEGTKKELAERISKNFDSLLADEIVKFLDSVSKDFSNESISNLENKNDLEKFAKKIADAALSQPFVTKALQRRIAGNLLDLFEEMLKSNSSDNPYCAICGKRQIYTKKEVNRALVPLLGSGDVPNYFNSANPHGADICAHCVFLTQFMPLASYRLSHVMVIHAYPYELMLELSKEALDDVRRNALASQARGFRRPENFLFRKIAEITQRRERDNLWENTSVTIYYFICNNQNQTLDVIHIPTPVLRFVSYASWVDPSGWRHIISVGWKEQVKEEDFETFERERKNTVYSRLLNEESILEYFVNGKLRQTNASWNLLAFYCSEVMGLDKEILNFVREVGDRIVDSIERLPDNKLGDEVRSLERTEKLYQFEAFFLRVEN